MQIVDVARLGAAYFRVRNVAVVNFGGAGRAATPVVHDLPFGQRYVVAGGDPHPS
jgi:hypothetical protein